MSSPGSDSSWCVVDLRDQQVEAARRKQAMLYQQAHISSSAANLSSARRLGTSRTHVQLGHRDEPPPLTANVPVSAPASTSTTTFYSLSRGAPTEFPRSEEKAEREPPKGSAFKRKLKTSLLGGKNPFVSSTKASDREKDRKDPTPLPPESEAVVYRRPELNGSTPELPTTVPTGASRGNRPPPVNYSRTLYSAQSPQPSPRRSSSTAPPDPAPERVKHERSRSKSREIPIVEAPSHQVEDVRLEREPVLGALQAHHRSPVRAVTQSAPPPSESSLSTIRPPPQTPTSTQPAPPRPLPAPQAPKSTVVVTSVPQPTRPSQESLHPGSHYRSSQSSQQTSSSPPVVRYKTSSDRTSYATTATTPSLGSSVKTHGSQIVSDPPPKEVERIQWAAAPPSRPSHLGHARAPSANQAEEADAWSQSMAQLTLRQTQQPGYHMEMSSKHETAQSSPAPSTQEAKSQPRKLQRHATTAAPSTATTYYYYDPSPPLITKISRLSELKEDYRNPGSERSTIIRRKINYLRFELGFTGLRRARGDGNCFYRSFAFSYLEQIIFAKDRAVAVVSALEQLEMAQNIVDLAMPEHRFSQRIHLFVRDIIRNIELGKTDQRKLLHIFQDQRDSDDIVAYVRILASAYIRITPEMHASVFHPDDPMTVITPSDFCSIYVEQLGQDADHLQISALSKTLNVSIYIYRLDDKVDGESAPHEQDLPAHCTRFVPTDAPPVTDPVFLLFRPGHYDILERNTNY